MSIQEELHRLNCGSLCSFFIPQDLTNSPGTVCHGLRSDYFGSVAYMEALLTLPRSDLFLLAEAFHSSVSLHQKLLVNVS